MSEHLNGSNGRFQWQDLASGLVVFLVALPLCLGVAGASDAPLFSGMIAGFVGGIIISLISGSHLSVSGPAAGLASMVAAGIAGLGGMPAFQMAVVIAGGMQIVLGLFRAGVIGKFFPNSVIKGMLAAIGIILIFKQIPHAFGYDADFEGDFSFFQADHENSFSEILNAFSRGRYSALLISLTGILILVLADRPAIKKYMFIPAPLLVVIMGVVLNEFMLISFPELGLTNDHLVSVPVAENPAAFLGLFSLPDFSSLSQVAVWKTGFAIAIVASLESLLSIDAIDKLDPAKRRTPLNRELLAQGTGNLVSGFLGGLPVTSVIVRSSANMNAGAQSRWSAFTHGVLLLICVMFIPTLLNRIPMAALAAILLMTGYKLTSLKVLKTMIRAGWQQYLPFFVTILVTYFTDLLTGVGTGLGVCLVLILSRSMDKKNACSTEDNPDGSLRIILVEELSFLSKAALADVLDTIPAGKSIILDGSRNRFMDPDILSLLYEFGQQYRDSGGQVHMIGIPEPGNAVVSGH